MTKTSRQTPETAATVADAIAQMQRYGLQSMNWMGTDWVERMSDLGSEALNFLSERVKEDVELQHKLLHCRDVKEMQHIQGEYLQKAINQYNDEAGKMMAMGTSNAAPSASKDG